MNFLDQAKNIEETIINDRRNLHKIPELELNLPKTVAYVEDKLKSLNIRYKKLVNGNAIVAEIGSEDVYEPLCRSCYNEKMSEREKTKNQIELNLDK